MNEIIPEEVALYDLDGTLCPGFVLPRVFDMFAEQKLISEQDSNNLHDILAEYHPDRPEFNYERWLKRTLGVASIALRGQSVAEAAKLTESFVAEGNIELYGYVHPTLLAAEKAGVKTRLVTAEPEFVAYAVANAVGLDDHHSSEFGIDEDDGIFDGTVVTMGAVQKTEVAQKLWGTCITTGFGDSEGDIGMLSFVNNPVCIKPTGPLRTHAEFEGWTIVEYPDRPLAVVEFGLSA